MFAASVTAERLEFVEINRFLGRRSIGGLLLLLALPMAMPIPAPGVAVIFGLVKSGRCWINGLGMW